MISRIKNRTLRRVVLVGAFPFLIPVHCAIIAAAAVWDDLRFWPGILREVWSK